jgi:hypothetical protein
VNKGAGLPRGSSAIDVSRTDLFKGYDYNALILASADGKSAYATQDLLQGPHEGTVHNQVPVLVTIVWPGRGLAHTRRNTQKGSFGSPSPGRRAGQRLKGRPEICPFCWSGPL